MSARQRGIAVVEFALILPIMLILLFMIIEFGRAILTRQVLTNISREAANLSARGTPLADSLAAVKVSASPLNLDTNGYLILTHVFRNSPTILTVTGQAVAGGRPRPSHVGSAIGGPASLPALANGAALIPPIGQSLFVAEVFYLSDTITPLTRLVNVSIGDTFYDVAFF